MRPPAVAAARRSRSVSSSTNPASASRRAAPTRGSTSTSPTTSRRTNYTPTFVEAISAQRETLIKSGQVKYIVGTYSITDARKKDVAFAGPYFIAGQDLLIRSDDTRSRGRTPPGQEGCSVKGSTSAANVQKKYGAEIRLQEYGTYTLCVDALKSGAVDALTTDNAILAGYAAQEANKGKAQGRRPDLLDGELRRGPEELDDTAFCTKVTDVLKKWIRNRRMAEVGRQVVRPGRVSSRAPATRPPRRPAGRPVAPPADLSTTTGMPPAHLGGRHTCDDRVPLT